MRFLTQADIVGLVGQAIESEWIGEIDGNGSRTGLLFWSGSAGIVPSKSATVADVAAAASAILVADWAASTVAVADEVRRAPLTAGTIEAGDLIRSNSARTTGATFDAGEASNWTEFSPDIVTSVAGRTGAVVLAKGDVGLASVDNTADTAKPVSTAQQTAIDAKAAATHTHAQADVTGLVTGLAGKQATLVSGTSIRTVGGQSLLGAGNVDVAADLPGGTPTTVLDEGLDAGNATVDRTTVPGETILRYTTTGAASTFVAPLGITTVRTLLVGGGGGGGGGEGVTGGDGGGGGGAGAFRAEPAVAVTPGASVSVTVGVGGGGANSAGGTTGTNGTTGGNSLFGSRSAPGGGGGGGNDLVGSAGGSGGGGGGRCSSGVDLAGGAATAVAPNAGFAGGAGTGACTNRDGAGGGGAGGAGVDSSGSGAAGIAGAGGAAATDDITGSLVAYAGGGGGGIGGGQGTVGAGGAANSVTVGGLGGVSDGVGSAGAASTGSGGGGGGARTAVGLASGGAGGSGVVIVRFPTQTRTYQALQSFVNNAAAVTGGLLVGQFFANTTTGGIAQVT